MKRLFGLVIVLTALASAQYAASAQPTSVADIGVGPHGYDLLIGTWTCTDSMGSGGMGAGTLSVVSIDVGNTLGFHVRGKAFDIVGYIAYDEKTKTWLSPSAYFDGGYSTESSTQTGPKTVWAGSAAGAGIGSTKPVMVRDTYTFASMTQYNDVFEAQQADGTWKAQGNLTCNKQ